MASYNYITQTGVVTPDTARIVADTENDYKAVFGNDLIVTPDTPQGVLIQADALARNKLLNNNAELATQINPNYAIDAFLDAITALMHIERRQSTPSIINGVVITGVVGTVIPANTQARTTNGDIFYSQSEAVIGAGNSVTAVFISQKNGKIPCNANTLTTFVNPVLGAETINNPSGGIVGIDKQTDSELRAYRKNTLAFNSVGGVKSIESALFAIPSVRDCKVYENDLNVNQIIFGLLLGRQSIYAIVAGGDNLSIASAIKENKSLGCDTNGTQTVNIVEPVNGQVKTVRFDYASNANIIVEVTTSNGNQNNIKASVLEYFNGLKIRDSISPFEIAFIINKNNPEYYISNVRIALLGGTLSNASIDLNGNQIGYSQDSYITVVIA